MLTRMGVVLFQREPIGSLWPELLPLARDHWREVRWDLDSEADLDQGRLQAHDEDGTYRIFTARQDGELIGYAAYWINHHTQNQASLEADADAVYLRPDRRRGRTGTDLLKFADEALRSLGVRTVYQHVRGARDFGPVLERLGYAHIENLYARKLAP